ncbi:hypothetical protein WL30_12790 [Burkholderia ubonensis]|uniref:hypothetical protein n=1 Tax=Burkholderia ubonensis TaxID=101571 RepID=UPI00075E9756|nr:hypothetical protein [Burkholderia ubonensis]KWA72483.1 hypothetical protein WL30_12790 [Burkholderia ubonensis]KWB18488.1 hypothetical protein WL31_10890 [Burkholderia ubonensis]
MAYDPQDAAFDEMYERISDELYPEHKAQAVGEFTADRLQSFYLSNPMVMRPAVDALRESKRLRANGHSAAAVVFCATTIELLLKATLLQPIVHGLVHSAGLADVIVKHAVGETGFDRYRNLLSRLFQELAHLDLALVARDGVNVPLIVEGKGIQDLRNGIIHRGLSCDAGAADHAFDVAAAVYDKIVVPMLWSIGLTVGEKGRIERRQFT